MPQLVVADSSFKRYPGGVVAVRATDWLGSARGTLSTESDALASTGEVVRDAQQVTPTFNSFLQETEYGNADDTLVIPVDDIGLMDNTDYICWVTYKVDGGWDLTNETLLRKSDQRVFGHVCALGMHGAGFVEAFPDFTVRMLGNAEPYSVYWFFPSVSTGDTIRVRAFAHDGVSAEVLIDQLVFVPQTDTDLITQRVSPSSAGSLTTALVDGADGGDDNGKFTFKGPDLWNRFIPSSLNSSDYQRFADASDGEWNMRVTPSDVYPLADGTSEISAHGYSLHAVRHEPYSITDTFDNRSTTVNGADMGIDANGFGYGISTVGQALSPAGYVAGGVGILRIRQGLGTMGVIWGSTTQGASPGATNHGARITVDDAFIFSGEMEWTAGALATTGQWEIGFTTGGIAWELRLNVLTKIWQLGRFVGSTWTAFGATHDISSWWGLAAPLGFKIEVKRYVIRCRVWDASGAEPSTWDDEDFKHVLLSGTQYAYNYSDVFARAQAGYVTTAPAIRVQIRSSTSAGNTLPYDVTLHSLAFERDMYGSAEGMTVYLEQPEGDAVGEQIVPYGCPYFVYWGSRVWTEAGGGTQRLSFSSKVVNDPGAAELQRADSLEWVFVHLPGGIASMNWSSAKNFDLRRVHG